MIRGSAISVILLLVTMPSVKASHANPGSVCVAKFSNPKKLHMPRSAIGLSG
jgi:hypothetical protein